MAMNAITSLKPIGIYIYTVVEKCLYVFTHPCGSASVAILDRAGIFEQ